MEDKDKLEEKKPEEKPEETLSIVDEARAIKDEIVKAKEELAEERKKLEKVQSEALLSGTGGAATPIKEVSVEDQKKARAAEFFKDTALGDAIGRAK